MSESIKYLSKGLISIEVSIGIFVIWLGLLIYFWKKNKSSLINLGISCSILGLGAYAFLSHRGIPIPILFLILCASIVQFILVKIPLGRYIFAIGGNEQASYLSGVPIKKVKLIIYAMMGAFAGIAGTLLASRINSADPNAGLAFELDAIAAVVIGGTSLMGGKGSLPGTLIGAMIISTINNGMSLMGIDSIYQMVIKGIILIAAVWLDSRNNK